MPTSRDDGFRCDVHPDRDVVVVRPVGELDLATADHVDATLADLRAAGFPELVLDLRDVTFLDSSGVRLLVSWTRRAVEDGFRFAHVPGPEAVQQVLRMTGVDGYVPVAAAPREEIRA
ncbi:MAG TPA: STAS domain-containing protein [Baekduia sp.]|nr:STAS domain-containing protein [Baekduia sp.]